MYQHIAIYTEQPYKLFIPIMIDFNPHVSGNDILYVADHIRI